MINGVGHPTIYLAIAVTRYEWDALTSEDLREVPAILVSFAYMKEFLRERAKGRYRYRSMIIDSGAFTVFNSGGAIDLKEYVACCKELKAEDPKRVDGCFALDVIGDWKGSLENWHEMKALGVPGLIPVYHIGEPIEVLREYAAGADKVALGGVALEHKDLKLAWSAACFKELWPKRIHGLGFTTEHSALALPWHSVDSSSWEIGPLRHGRYKSIGTYTGSRSHKSLVPEIDWYLKLERKMRHKWRGEMALLEEAVNGNLAGSP